MDETKQQTSAETKLITVYTKTRSWISSALGIIVTILGVGILFVVASLEGTKEVKASGSDNAKIMTIWREQNPSEQFPEEKAEIIEYKNREYYFVVDKYNDETGNIEQWYFAYDGGIDYIFGDYKFYVMTALTIVVAIIVADINYSSSLRVVMNSEAYLKTLGHYQKKKEAIEGVSQYIPDYCNYKNKQAYETARRDIIEDAGINFEVYNSGKVDISALEKWQIKTLNKIKGIKIKKIHTSDLLQEHGNGTSRIHAILPMSQKEHQRRFLISGAIQKMFTSALGGLTVGFGIVLGNWVLGLTYGLVIIMSFISSIVIATDFGTTTLRNRYLAKADLLNEFSNIKERFMPKIETPKEIGGAENAKQ